MNEKFNFSKLTSREKVPRSRTSAVGRGGALARGRQGRGLQGGGGRVGQPDPAVGPAASLLGAQPGGLRMTPSGTNHAHVGAMSGEADIGSILRGSAM